MLTIDNEEVIVGAEHRRLTCGLNVLVHQDRQLPQVALSMMYRAGSTDEQVGQSGLAHLVEHLFKNSLHVAPRLHYEVLRSAGATDANASTSADRTEYHETLPAHQLALGLWLEADRLGYFLPALTQARLTQQQAVVRAERRQRYENAAFGKERVTLGTALYPEGHPQRHLTIGTHEDIAAASLASVTAFYQTYYPPANATLVIAGDVELPHAWDLVEQYFGSFPTSRDVTRDSPTLAPTLGTAHVCVDEFAKFRRLRLVWRGPAVATDELAPLDVLCATLARAGTGPLWRTLVYETRLAIQVGAFVQANRLGSEIHIVVDLPGNATDAQQAEVQAHIGTILGEISTRITGAHVAAVINRRFAASLWAMQSLRARVKRLQHWALYRDAAATASAQRAHRQLYTSLQLAQVHAAMRFFATTPTIITTVPSKALA